MRVRNWNPKKYDDKFSNVAYGRLRDGAEIIASEVRTKLQAKIGQGKTTGISRPVYQTGKYAGKAWTARYFGALMKSIRVVEKKERWGFELDKERNIRVYAGHYLAYYAKMVEYRMPYMRPAWRSALRKVKSAIVK